MMKRYDKIGKAVRLSERYFCVLNGIKEYDPSLYANDLCLLRQSLIESLAGDSRDELVDFTEERLDVFIEFLQGKISRIK